MGARNRSRPGPTAREAARQAGARSSSQKGSTAGSQCAEAGVETTARFAGLERATAFSSSLAIIAIALALNANTLGHGFVYDDARGIVTNGDVLQSNPLANLFINDFWGKPMSRFQSHKSYRPLTVLTFRLSHRLGGGLDSWGFHVGNVLVHALTCCLFFCAARRVFGAVSPALVAALLFTVHPIHCEAVANVVGRAELLGGAWFLVALLVYARSISPGGASVSSVGLTASMLAAAAAMLSKEQGITVLAVIVVYDFSVVGGLYPAEATAALFGLLPQVGDYAAGLRRRVAVVGVTGTLLLAFRVWMMGGGQPIFNDNELPALECPSSSTRILTFAYYAVVNMGLLVFPVQLCSDWSYRTIPLVTSLTEQRGWAIAAAFGIFCAAAAYMLVRPRASSPLAGPREDSGAAGVPRPFPMHFGVATMLLTFLPSSNLLFPVGFVVAERILYLPSMGFCIIVAAVLCNLSHRRPTLAKGALVVLLVALASKTVTRNAEWSSDFDLHEAGVRDNPGNVKLLTNFGMLLHERAQDTAAFTEPVRQEYSRRAEATYTHTLANVIGEDNFPNLYFSYGNLLQSKGRADEAIALYRRGLEKKDKTRTTLNILNNLGSLLYKQQQYDEAELHFDTCIAIDDGHLSAHNGLAALYAATNRSELAEEKFALVVQRNPGSAEAHFNHGTLLATKTGRYTEAEGMFIKALELNPAHSGAKSNLEYVRYQMKHSNKS